MKHLKIEEIKKIPGWYAEGKTAKEIGVLLGVHERTINYWVKQLRRQGVRVKTKRGRRVPNLAGK